VTKPNHQSGRAGRVRESALPTLEDVARSAGVSTATVSRCLNSPDLVVEQTRTKVLEAVQALGYAPNFGARALAAKRSNTVGAIIPTMENAIFARGLQAFQEELDTHGVTLLVASSSYRPAAEATQVRTLTARGADGLLLIGHDRLTEVYEFLDRRAMPYVIAWAHDPGSPRASVGFDNFAAMKELATAVLDLGHTRIGLISAPTETNDRARRRLEGVRSAMLDRGLDPQALRLIETPYAYDTGARAFASLMQADDRPSVVLCGNDVLAVGALRQAHKMGLRVPQDVSITGFDDIEIAQVVTPSLTTVHVPHREMGRQAALALVGLINAETTPTSVALGTDIRWRDTLAAPGGAAPAGESQDKETLNVRH